MVQNQFNLKKDILLAQLRNDILSGKHPHGSKLPVEVTLAGELGVSRDTLRASLKALEDEGLLVRLRSKGTFVNLPKQPEKKQVLVMLKPGSDHDISYVSHHIMPGIQKMAMQCGLEVEIAPWDYLCGQQTDTAAKMLRQRNLAGCVIFEGRYNGREEYIRVMQLAEVPVVMAACHEGDVETTGFAGVRTDQVRAWNDGILALRENGHRRIATLMSDYLRGYHEDIDAYRKFLRREKIDGEDLIFSCRYTQPENYQDTRAMLTKLMNQSRPPTAIMCYSDFFAITLLQAAAEMGIQIPRKLAVMGCCGFAGGRYLSPPLATVDFHFARMGEKAVELLLRAEQWRQPDMMPPEIIVPHEIIMRESAMIKRCEHLFV